MNKTLQETISRLEDENQKVVAKYIAEKEKNVSPHCKQRGTVPAEIKTQWDVPPSVINKPDAVGTEKRQCLHDEKRQQFIT